MPGAERGAVDLGPAQLQVDRRPRRIVGRRRSAADGFVGERGQVVGDDGTRADIGADPTRLLDREIAEGQNDTVERQLSLLVSA